MGCDSIYNMQLVWILDFLFVGGINRWACLNLYFEEKNIYFNKINSFSVFNVFVYVISVFFKLFFIYFKK